NGPSYETKAEINAYRRLGGDVVGMSTVPEVIIAKWAGMKILGISCITNKATGLGEKKLSHQEVLEVANKTNDKLTKILTETINQID
nr:purine-nucleoside phosphorylase [Bacillota bacterium]